MHTGFLLASLSSLAIHTLAACPSGNTSFYMVAEVAGQKQYGSVLVNGIYHRPTFNSDISNAIPYTYDPSTKQLSTSALPANENVWVAPLDGFDSFGIGIVNLNVVFWNTTDESVGPPVAYQLTGAQCSVKCRTQLVVNGYHIPLEYLQACNTGAGIEVYLSTATPFPAIPSKEFSCAPVKITTEAIDAS